MTFPFSSRPCQLSALRPGYYTLYIAKEARELRRILFMLGSVRHRILVSLYIPVFSRGETNKRKDQKRGKAFSGKKGLRIKKQPFQASFFVLEGCSLLRESSRRDFFLSEIRRMSRLAPGRRRRPVSTQIVVAVRSVYSYRHYMHIGTHSHILLSIYATAGNIYIHIHTRVSIL